MVARKTQFRFHQDELNNTTDRNDALPFQDPRGFAVKAQAGWQSAIGYDISGACTNAISDDAQDSDQV